MTVDRRTFGKILGGGALAATVARIMAGARPAWALVRGGTLNVGLAYDIDTLNVYSTGYLGDVQAAVVEGLVAPDEHAEYVPVLATEVPTLENGGIVLSEDGKTMKVTYKLRPGVTWHDGTPFTSADVKFTWEAVKNPDFIAESKDGTEDVDSIDTPDDLTAIVNYNTVAPDFKSTLFTFGIFPKHALEGKDLNTDVYNEKPLGTGPFMVTTFERGQYVEIVKNPSYWRKADDGAAYPYLDSIVFKIITDSNTLVTQLRSGEVQFAYSVPYQQAKQLEGVEGLEIVKNTILSWQHLDFNFKNPALADLTVRRAFAQSIDRDTMIKAAGGYPLAIKSVVLPVFEGIYDENVPVDAYDPEAAKAALEAAGWVAGDDGIRAKDGNRLSFRCLAQAGRADDEVAQQVLIAMMKAVGVEVTPDNKTGVAFRDSRYKGDYDLYYGRWITSADPVYSVFFGTGGANNGQGYSNPALDAVFAKLENTLVPEERKQYAAEMQKILYDDLPTIPVTTNVAIIAKTTKLKGFKPNPTNMTNFVDTSGWYLEG